NTLQTNATQMVPEARATAVAGFSSLLFLGASAGVALAAPIVDRAGAVPVFLLAAMLWPALAILIVVKLRGRETYYGLPRGPRSISARTIRSTRPGRLSSIQDLSIGRSISFTRSSSVRAFCPSTVWASALNALSTACAVACDISAASVMAGADGR